jgi:hypothetical protein
MIQFFTDDMIKEVHTACFCYKGSYPAKIRTDYGEFHFYENKSWFWSFGNQHGLRYSSSTKTVRIGFFDSAHKQQGSGVIKFPNGNMYEGHVQDNLFHGEGVLTSTVDDIHHANSSTWTFGLLRGNVKIIYANKDIYIGEYNGKPHGRGIMSYPSKIYNCLWVNGIATGSDAVITFQEMQYTGDCVNGIPHGYGVMTYDHTDEVVKGQWRNGIFCKLPPPPPEEDDFIITHDELKIQKKKPTLGAYISPAKAKSSRKVVIKKRSYHLPSDLNLQSYSQSSILSAIYAIKTLKPRMLDDDTQDYKML